MAKYRIDSIADLARQLTFTPQDTRLAQVAAAEDLLHSIEPTKAYPLDFVVFRITGYRGKSTRADASLLTGIALQHDLGLLIEQTSETLDVHTDALAEPVLTIDDVTERFNVTSKTIQRWRRKGLPGRRFTFADGKRRVGFLLNSVERFLHTHQDQLASGTNFSQVEPAERDAIVRRARRLALEGGCCTQEISRRIARKLKRSPLTILHTIRKHDEQHRDDAIFPRAGQPLTDEARAKLLRAYRNGVSIRSLASRVGRARSAIYRIVLEERFEKLNCRKIRFIDDELYHSEDAASVIAQIADQEDSIAAASRVEDKRIPRDLPAYLQDLYRTPLLTPPQERALFLKFNFRKYQFVQARRRLDPELARSRDLNDLEMKLRHATDVKNDIVQANLRLVVSIARKHLRPGSIGRLNLMELVSEGNITLMRAVESFDAHKGNRFSTYATLALMKGFARSVPQLLADGAGGRAFLAAGHKREALQPEIEDRRNRSATAGDRLVNRDEVTQLIARLDDRERSVLLAHFGIGEGAGDVVGASERRSEEPSTYAELADRFGLSRQRIRQIETAALEKLRAAVR